jgi:hypothetical protein
MPCRRGRSLGELDALSCQLAAYVAEYPSMRRSTQEIAMFNVEHTPTPIKSWNTGRIIGPKAPLKAKHISVVRTRLTIDHRIPDLALFNLAIDSELRGCDLMKLRLNDVISGMAIRT